MQRYWITLSFVVVIAGLSVLLPTQSVGLKSDAMIVLPTLFTTILLICLFVERAIEVFLSALRSGGADQIDANIARLQQAVGDEAAAALSDAFLERGQYRTHSRLIAQQMGLCFGLLIALVGFRILENLAVAAPGHWQGKVFVLVDVILTGSVLAGGSDAVNKLTKAYSRLMNGIRGK